MASYEQSRPTTEPISQGLDRTAYTVLDTPKGHLISPLQPEKPEEHSSSSSGSKFTDQELKPDVKEKLSRISKKFGNNVKSKADVVLHPTQHKKEHSTDPTTVPTLAPPATHKADDDRMFQEAPEQKGPSFQDVLKRPVSTVQNRFLGASGAKFAATMDNQVVAHGAEVRLVRAHDELVNAESEKDRINAADNLEELKKARQDSFVRWTMDRHVLMVRRVPKRSIPWPKLGDYKVGSEDGEPGQQWSAYGHHELQTLSAQQLLRYYIEYYGDQYIDENPNLPTPSEEALNNSIERLMMISSPYQVLLMKICRIYRWDDPTETAKYLAAYIILWAMSYMTGAAILTLLCLVLKRRLQPPTLEDIRAALKRSEDVETTAQNLAQLIEQHGSHGWIEVLRADLGPWLLLQLEDLADILEIWRNFYEWRDPTRTKITLVILTTCWLAITLIPLHVLIKITQFSIGVIFFGLFPIATHYPQYRLLASPLKWLMWRVPTDAEWAIARLQSEAGHRKEAMQQAGQSSSQDCTAESKPDDEAPGKTCVSNLGKHNCTSRNHLGHLYVSSEGVKYVSAIRKHLLWEVRFEQLKLMEKVGGREGLRFVHTSEEEFRVSGLKLRDEVFTQIVGYSGLRWRVSGRSC